MDNKIKRIILANQCGSGSFHEVGLKGVTEIKIDCRRISSDTVINVILVKKGDKIVEEISMFAPYIITYDHEEQKIKYG